MLKKIITGLLLICCTMGVAFGQQNVVLNPTGGQLANGSDGLKVIVSSNGSMQVFHWGAGQWYPGSLWNSNPDNYGTGSVGLALKFYFDQQGQTSVSQASAAFVSCGKSIVTGTGTSADPYTMTLQGTTTSPISNKIFYVTIVLNYVAGSNYYTIDYFIRAPMNLVTPEKVTISLDEDDWIGNSAWVNTCFSNPDPSRPSDYGVSFGNSNNLIGTENTISSHYLKVSSVGYSSYFAGFYNNRTQLTSGTHNYTNLIDPTLVDVGLAVQFSTPYLSAGQIGARRILHGYGGPCTNGDYNAITVTDPVVSGVSTPVVVGFVNSANSVTEGDASHAASGIQISVSGGILAQPQAISLTASGGTASSTTDYNYQQIFTVPAGDYTTPQVFDVGSNFTILGNIVPQADRTFNISFQANCNDLITVGTSNPTTTVTISDDDRPQASIQKISDVTTCSQTNVFNIVLSKAVSTPTTVNLSYSGSSNVSDLTLPATITVPANTTVYTYQLTPATNNIINETKILNATITSVSSNSISGTIAASPANTTSINIIDCDDLAANKQISFAPTAVNVNEGSSTNITVSLPAGITSVSAITVPYTVSGTATSGSDYTALSGSVTIPAGSNSATIVISALADNIIENDETVIITGGVLSGGYTYVTGKDVSTVTIKDQTGLNPANKQISFAPTTVSVNEGSSTNITVSLPTGITSTSDIIVPYTVSGTATSGSDYTALSGSVTIPAGSNSATIVISALADNIIESNETVIITGSALPAGFSYVTGANISTVTIVDQTGLNPSNKQISFAPTTVSVNEGSSTNITISLPTGITSASDIIVPYTISGTATSGSDYTALSGSVTIPAGSNSATIVISALADNIIENDETVIITGGVLSGGYTYVTGKDVSTVTIKDQTGTVATNKQISILPTAVDVNEGAGTTVTVSLPTGITSSTPIVVPVSISGTATITSDYTISATTSVTIPANTNAVNITVNAITDNIIEGDETVIITGGTLPAGYTFVTGKDVSTVTIKDQTGIVTTNKQISILPTAVDVNEGAGTTVTVSLPTGITSSTPIVVPIALSGTATITSDYTISATTSVTIPANTNAVNITVNALTDNIIEGDETVIITGGTLPAGYTYVTGKDVSTVTIKDQTGTVATNKQISILPTAVDVNEGSSTNITVSLPTGITSASDIIVPYTISGTATSGSDYTALSGSVTIPAGSNSATIAVSALADNIIEDDETVIITGSTLPAGYTYVTGKDVSTVTIKDQTGIVTTNKQISILPTAVDVNEGSSTNITISLPTGITSASDIIVPYTISGTATSGSDYTALSGSVTIPAGSNSATIAVSALADNIIEDDETVIITGSALPAGFSYATGANISTVTIKDQTGTVATNKQISILPTAVDVNEGAGTTVTVSLPTGITSSNPIVVPITIGGTATPTTDYTISATTSVTIPANTNAVNITVNALTDNIIENDETVIITGGTLPAGYTYVTGKDVSTVTIKDQTGTVATNKQISILPTAVDVNEGSSTNITISLPTGITSASDIIVPYTISGTATSGSDYTALSGSVTIPAGSNSATIVVSALADNIIEDDETVIITGGTLPAGYTFVTGKDVSTVTIKDQTGIVATNKQISILPTAVDVNEGSSTTVTVSLPTGITSSTPIVVPVTIGGTATPTTDYTISATTSVTIPANTNAVNITVNALADNIIEGDETVIITGGTLPAGYTYVTGKDVSTVTIKDQTGTVATNKQISILPTAVDVNEGSSTNITVSLPTGITSASDIIVPYTISGTATSGSDYTALSGSVTIPAGSNSATIAVSALADNIIEDDETVIITGSTLPAGYTYVTGKDISTVTIKDQTGTVATNKQISILPTAVDVNEGAGTTVTVSLPTGITSSTPIVVPVSISGTATITSDYTISATTSVTIPANTNAVNITVNALTDNIIEDDETVIITGSTLPAGYTYVTGKDVSTVTIKDQTGLNGNNAITLSVSPATLSRGGSAGTITAALPAGIVASSPIVINVSTLGTGLTSGVDYLLSANTITIPANTNAISNVTISALCAQAFTGNLSLAIGGTTNNFTVNGTSVVVNEVALDNTITYSGSVTFCKNLSLTLTAPSASSFEWYKDGIAINGATGSTFRSETTGAYTVKVFDGNGCYRISNPVNITTIERPQAPTVVPDGTISLCTGGTIMMSASGAANSTSYQWYKDGTIIPGATNTTYFAATPGVYKVTTIVSGYTCHSDSSAAATIVASQGTAPSKPHITGSSNMLCGSGSILLTTDMAAGLSYQWYKNGVAIAGATSYTYTATASGAGDISYVVLVKDAAGDCSNVSDPFVITAGNGTAPVKPVIQSSSNILCGVGSNAVLQSSTTGTSYQWYKDGVAISGAISRILTVNVAGSYIVQVLDAGGCSSVSDAVAITVSQGTGLAQPTILQSGSVVCGTNGRVLLTADLGSGVTTGITYKWYLDGAVLTGATAQSVIATQAGTYIVEAQDAAAGCVNSSAPVAINAGAGTAPLKPQITSGSTTMCTSGSILLTATAVPGVAYQWYYNSFPITGANQQTYIATAAGNYHVAIKELAGTCSNVSDALAINPSSGTAPAKPTILQSGNIVCSNGSVLLVSDITAPAYQWYYQGIAVTDATNRAYVAVQGGTYSVSVSDGVCSSVSNAVLLATSAGTAPQKPVITASSTTICSGGSITLTADITGGVTYQWYYNDIAISGGINRILNATMPGKYRVAIVEGGSCTSVSEEMTINNSSSIAPGVPAISGETQIVCTNGHSVKLMASPVVGATAYQWYVDGVLIAGANANAYNTTTPGTYQVTAGNVGCSSALSTGYTLLPGTSVATSADITISGSNNVCYNSGTVLNASATISQPVFKWYRDAALTDLFYTGNQYPTSMLSTDTTFYVTLSNVTTVCENAPGTGKVELVTVKAKLDLRLTTPATVCTPATVNLTASAVTNGSSTGMSYVYSSDSTGLVNNPLNSAIYITNAAAVNASGRYYIRGTANGCWSDVKGVNVTINNSPVITTTAIAPVCAPNTIDLRSGISNYDANNYTYTFTDAMGVAVANPGAISVTGVYNVTAANKTSGCSADVQMLQAVIHPKPVVSMVTLTPGAVCAPATVNIKSLITNYNATQYAYSYTDQNNQNVTVPTAIAVSGSYAIAATDNNTHCSSDPVNVVVKVNAQPVVNLANNGNMALCGNTGTVDLRSSITNFNTAGYNYTFTDAGGNLLSDVSAIGLPGTYYVTANDINTLCPSVKTGITLTRYALPTVTVTDPASVYDPYTIDITAPGITAGSTSGLAYSYYNSSNDHVTTAQAQAISGPGSYVYYIQGTTAQGCKSNIAPVNVLIKDRPVLSISSAEIMEGQSVTLNVNLPAGVTIPDAIKVVLADDRTASTIRVGDYSMPSTVTIPANTNSATFTVNTWDNNVLDQDRILVVIGNNSIYKITNGTVLIHDSTSLKPGNKVITIGHDTIYSRGTATVRVTLPDGISTSYPIAVNIFQAGGSTIGSAEYSMDANIEIPAGTNSGTLHVTVPNGADHDRTLNIRGESSGFTVKDGGVYIRKSRINVIPLVSDNNDGINDYLKIEGIDKYISKAGGSNKVTLFSRWEDVIYEASNYDNTSIRFDGRGNKHGTGRPPDGVYFYVITIEIPDNELGTGEQKTQTFKGYFRLQK